MSYTIYKQVLSSAPADYVLQKLRGSLNPENARHPKNSLTNELSNLVREGAVPGEQLPKLASPDQFYTLDNKALRIIELSKRCALADLHTSSPLIMGEVIESEQFSYLAETYDDVPAGTGALVRKTNYATTIHLFEGTLITSDGLVNSMVVTDKIRASEPTLVGGENLVARIILKILSAAASSVGSKIGASIFNSVSDALFGPDSDDLAKTISETMRGEVSEGIVDAYAGQLNGIIDYLMTDYQNRKSKSDLSDKSVREGLYTKLESYSEELYKVIGVLSEARFERVGLQSYMLASSMHILLYQEAALVDPKTTDPNDSDKFLTMQSRASVFHNHVNKVFQSIVNERLSHITLERFSTSVTVDFRTIERHWVVYKDTVDNINMSYGDDKAGKNYAWLKGKYDAHIQEVRQGLIDTYSKPDHTYLPHIATIASPSYRIT